MQLGWPGSLVLPDVNPVRLFFPALNLYMSKVLSYRPVPRKKNSAPFFSTALSTESGIAAFALALGADTVGNLTPAEAKLVNSLPDVKASEVNALRNKIRDGGDPLGEAFCTIRSANVRRESGAIYTPYKIVEAMLGWAATIGAPDRIVDPGAGSGRFLIEAGRQFKRASLVAVETDPLAALLTRANIAAVGMFDRTSVLVKDFRSAEFEQIDGRTLYIGNPPYVRHHLIDGEWKRWLKEQSAELGLKASSLAGLHVYFFLAIARWAKAGDYGALISASEWLDVNYGQLVRDLFLNRLGGQAVYVIEPHAEPFPGTQSTAAVTTFTVNGKPPSARFARIDKLDDLDHLSRGRRVSRTRLLAEPRWSHFTRKAQDIPSGYVELGELCRVHRGQVTGANHVWIAGEHSEGLPDEVLFPTVTKAMELFRAGQVLVDVGRLRRVIDLPVDLSKIPAQKRDAIKDFLKRAEKMGAMANFTAKHRKAWWSVGLREPAPVLATYMARRPPAFVLNKVKARHLNIAHGLYPREPLAENLLRGLVQYLREAPMMERGRVYSGGLTKFEPREMERIPIPPPTVLMQIAK